MAAGLTLAMPHAEAASRAVSGTEDEKKEAWFNEPRHWHREGSVLTCVADPKTDFWRKTFYGYTTDNGHLFYRRITGDFTSTVKFEGKYQAQYDQAGLMVRLNPQNWMKCGIEFVDGKPHISAVFTKDFSDWSTFRLDAPPSPFWVKVVRKGDSLDILHSLNGTDFAESRLGYFVPSETVMVGPMCAAPEGKGFEVRFEDWMLMPATAS